VTESIVRMINFHITKLLKFDRINSIGVLR